MYLFIRLRFSSWYTGPCLVKQSEALLGSNLARDSQVRTGERSRRLWGATAPGPSYYNQHSLVLPSLKKSNRSSYESKSFHPQILVRNLTFLSISAGVGAAYGYRGDRIGRLIWFGLLVMHEGNLSLSRRGDGPEHPDSGFLLHCR